MIINTFCIEIRSRQEEANSPHLHAAHQLGYTQLTGCQASRLVFLQGAITPAGATRLAKELLADPVTEEWSLSNTQLPLVNVRPLAIDSREITIDHFLDVTLLPGVTDPPAANLLRAAQLLGVNGLERAATGQRYTLSGSLDEATRLALAREIFANPVIQRFTIDEAISPPFFPYHQADNSVDVIPVRGANDDNLLAISHERRLALDLAEMQAIRAYFQQEERDPTDVELEMLAQTWSEHCVHKTFKALIEYTGPDGQGGNGRRHSQHVHSRRHRAD